MTTLQSRLQIMFQQIDGFTIAKKLLKFRFCFEDVWNNSGKMCGSRKVLLNAVIDGSITFNV